MTGTVSFPPQAFLIGAMKAGTTSLANWLDQHPRLGLSRPKEPAFFTRNWERGLDWYRDCFAGLEADLLLDASTANANAPTDRFPARQASSAFAGVPARIKQLSPEAKFIYVLREPAARCHSAYWHAVREGWEARSFGEALSAGGDLLRASDYAGQIALYLDHFPPTSFHFLLFEEMVRDPAASCDGCFAFLGLEAHKIALPTELRHSHASFRFNPVGRALGGSGRAYGALKTVAKQVAPRLPEGLRRLAKSAVTARIPQLSDADRRIVLDRLGDRRAELERLTGLDLGAWPA